jgi:hypothetical protein
MPLERTPSLIPPATSTRPSGSPTDAAPVGSAPISPAPAHVPLATCGTSARTTIHVEAASTATANSAAHDRRRGPEPMMFEASFISVLFFVECDALAFIGFARPPG